MNVGHLYVVHTALSRPPKDKLTICICGVDDFFFWINTKAAYHGCGQFALAGNDHQALHHDCFLDCSRATTFPPHELAAALDRGPISRTLATRIIAYLQSESPKTLSARYLNLALANLAALA